MTNVNITAQYQNLYNEIDDINHFIDENFKQFGLNEDYPMIIDGISINQIIKDLSKYQSDNLIKIFINSDEDNETVFIFIGEDHYINDSLTPNIRNFLYKLAENIPKMNIYIEMNEMFFYDQMDNMSDSESPTDSVDVLAIMIDKFSNVKFNDLRDKFCIPYGVETNDLMEISYNQIPDIISSSTFLNETVINKIIHILHGIHGFLAVFINLRFKNDKKKYIIDIEKQNTNPKIRKFLLDTLDKSYEIMKNKFNQLVKLHLHLIFILQKNSNKKITSRLVSYIQKIVGNILENLEFIVLYMAQELNDILTFNQIISNSQNVNVIFNGLTHSVNYIHMLHKIDDDFICITIPENTGS